MSFFNGFRAKAELQPGRRALFSGKITRYGGALGLTNPDFQLLDEDPDIPGMDPEKLAAMPIPVYPATAKLTSWSIQKVISTLLDTADLDALPDPLPAEIAAREKFLPVADAYRLIHAPQTPAGLAARPGPVPLPGSPGAPVGPGPAPRPARRGGGHRPPARPRRDC